MVTSFFVVLVIAFFPRLFEFGQHLVTQCYILVNLFIKPFLRIFLMCISFTGAILSMTVVSFPIISEYAQLMSVNFEYSGNLAFSSSSRCKSLAVILKDFVFTNLWVFCLRRVIFLVQYIIWLSDSPTSATQTVILFRLN